MKRRFPERYDNDDSDEYEAYEDSVKLKRLLPEGFGSALGGDGLQEVMVLVDEIVAEQFTSFLTDSPTESLDISGLLCGMAPEDLSRALFDGEPFVFEAPDEFSDDKLTDEQTTELTDEQEEPVVEDFVLQEDGVEDPDAYAWQIAEELCDEILDEIVAEELSGWLDEAERNEVLAMTELAPTREKILTAVYQAVWEQWGAEPGASDD